MKTKEPSNVIDLPVEPLTPAEETLLTQLEKAVTECMSSVTRLAKDCATALAQIRIKKLYRAEFKTFQDYCIAKWGKDRRAINYMIEEATLKEDFGKNHPNIEKALIEETSGASMRALAKVPKKKREKAFVAASEKAGGKAPKARDVVPFQRKPRGGLAAQKREAELEEIAKANAAKEARDAEAAKLAEEPARRKARDGGLMAELDAWWAENKDECEAMPLRLPGDMFKDIRAVVLGWIKAHG